MSRSEIGYGKKKRIAIMKSEATEGKFKEWAKKIGDFFPAEVIALYTTLWGIAVAFKDEISFNVIAWIIFGVGVLGVIAWLRVIDKIKNWFQIIAAVFAYVGWVFTVSSPFNTLSWYHEAYGLILLGIIAFFVPIFGYKKEPEPK